MQQPESHGELSRLYDTQITTTESNTAMQLRYSCNVQQAAERTMSLSATNKNPFDSEHD